MGRKRTDEFRADAGRIALRSGLTRKQVASDLGVGLSTLNKWATAHRNADMVVLAQCEEQSRLSLASYGRPRMTEELKELGLSVGHRRVGRLMRETGIPVERSKRYKVTTDSNHAFNIAPNMRNRDFRSDQPNQKWVGDISYV